MRLFVAVALPEELKQLIGQVVRPLKSLPGSWTSGKNQHLTLAFLGEQDEASVPEVESAMQSGASGVDHFEATLARSGFFPDARRQRVGWIGVDSGGRLEEVAESVRASLRTSGLVFDDDRFTPHLTLVRLRSRWRPEEVRRFETAVEALNGARFPIERIDLVSSELRRDGAVHTVVASAKLKAAATSI